MIELEIALHFSRGTNPKCASSLFGLAPGEVYHAIFVAKDAVGSYPTFSPLPLCRRAGGGIFSAALSLKVAIAHHPHRRLSGTVFPWSPDFPLT